MTMYRARFLKKPAAQRYAENRKYALEKMTDYDSLVETFGDNDLIDWSYFKLGDQLTKKYESQTDVSDGRTFVYADLIGMHRDFLGFREKYTTMRVVEADEGLHMWTYKSGVFELEPGNIYQFRHEEPHALLYPPAYGNFRKVERVLSVLGKIAQGSQDMSGVITELFNPNRVYGRKKQVVFGGILFTHTRAFKSDNIIAV